MFDPMRVPMPVRASSREAEGAQHPLVAALVNHPFLTSPDDERHLRQLRATYYGMQAEVDDQIGRILDHLDATGESERTVVVVTSDHGEMLGDHYLMHKLGWFDPSYHVPLIVRDPRAEADARRGETVHAYTEHVDVLPTLLDLFDAEVPLQCDGRPLTGFLHGGAHDDDPWRDAVHFEFDFRDAGSDLLERAFGLTLEECSIAVLRDDHGKYVHFAGLPPIFFDLDTDPVQITNVANDPRYASHVLAYAQRMLTWRMRHQERTLSGMKLTGHAGLVERRAPRR
jgi:arylsulfatase A-like enzyme